MNLDWKIFCDNITDLIWDAIRSIVGTPQAGQKVEHYQKGTKMIDAVAEEVVIEYIKKEKSDILLLSEEIGEFQVKSNPKYTLVLDPIDGTTNSIRGIPFFSTSIAVARGSFFKDLIFGYIRNYLTDEIFYADQNGAFYKNQRCEPSKSTTLGNALIALYSYNNVNYAHIKKVLKRVGKMRLFGAVSLELVSVGANLLDALIDFRGNLKVSDIAGGIHFMRKVGGIATSIDGHEFEGKLDINQKYTILATGNQILHDKLKSIIND